MQMEGMVIITTALYSSSWFSTSSSMLLDISCLPLFFLIVAEIVNG